MDTAELPASSLPYGAPRLIMTCDPDSVRSALASAVWDDEREGYVYCGSAGGGRGKPVEWQTITGQLVALEFLLAWTGIEAGEVLFVCETQAAVSEWTRDVEALRRSRYHWQAACELLGIKFKTVTIAWAQIFVPGALAKGKGAQKKAYRLRAQTYTDGETTNEDRCAAFGILFVEIDSKNFDLYID